MQPSTRNKVLKLHALLPLGSAAIAAGFIHTSCLEPADQIMERYGEGRIVFVKDPSVGGQNMNRDIAMAANPDEFHPGSFHSSRNMATTLIMLPPLTG